MKIKENIKKIGNRKNCLLLALLILALLFTVLMPKINIGTQKASALGAPQTKTLDLNGQSYSYQTSLNELRNNYNVLNQFYNYNLFTLQENTEGENHCTLFATTGLMTEEENTQIKNILDENIIFYKNGNKLVNEFIYDTSSATDYPPFTFGDVNNNEFTLSDVTSINLNLENLYSGYFVSATQQRSNSLLVQFLYFKNNFNYNDIDNNNLYNNTISYFYSLSRATEYNFDILKLDGYYLKAVAVFYEDGTQNKTDLDLETYLFNKDIVNYQQAEPFFDGYIFPYNIKFIQNNNANIISFNADITESGQYKGTLLLSENKWDTELFDLLKQNSSGFNIKQSFKGKVYFGRNQTQSTNFGYMNTSGAVTSLVVDFINGFDDKNPPQFLNNSDPLFIYSSTNNKISYRNQNQLLFVEEAQDLRINAMTNQTYTGRGLSAQVEDILYSVEYLGETEKIQQEQEIQKDFENMLYVTGAFAVIGLLFGFVFGNPVLGLVIGAIVGFGLTIIPIILDGLQAIFGQQFLDGLQNFFRSIASAIAGVVSSILNFLFSIITNPAVLVLVLIVAILYLFVFRKK